MTFKISQRLKDIDQMVNRKYDHIWDCCCDHGHLGFSLLERKAANTIHFVDINPALISDVESQLNLFTSSNNKSNNWKTHCLDAAKLPLSEHSPSLTPNSHLIIIAGVGGDLVIDMIAMIIENNPEITIEFILCPVHHLFKVRQKLIDMGLKLINEKLIEENKRFYEIIHVGNSSQLNHTISAVGSKMWDFSRTIDQNYLDNILSHYQRKLKSGDHEARTIIDSYNTLTK